MMVCSFRSEIRSLRAESRPIVDLAQVRVLPAGAGGADAGLERDRPQANRRHPPRRQATQKRPVKHFIIIFIIIIFLFLTVLRELCNNEIVVTLYKKESEVHPSSAANERHARLPGRAARKKTTSVRARGQVGLMRRRRFRSPLPPARTRSIRQPSGRGRKYVFSSNSRPLSAAY